MALQLQSDKDSPSSLQDRSFSEGPEHDKIVSTKTNKIEWPWSGSVRRHIYLDFTAYLVLLVLFCSITLVPYTHRSRDAYNLVQSIQATLVKEFRPEPDIRFNNIHEIGGLKAWLERVFMAVFYGYQPNSMADEPTFKPMATYIPRLYLASTTILGPVRLRQLRVEANSCIKDVEIKWKNIENNGTALITECHMPYGQRKGRITRDSEFNKMWGHFASSSDLHERIDRFLASNSSRIPPGQSKEQLQAAKSQALIGFAFNNETKAGVYRGRFHSIYREQGFVLDLPENNEQAARTILAILSNTTWLDKQTRALFIEFSLYLPSSDLVLAARLVAEVHETGTVWTDHTLEPINLATYRTELEPTTRKQLALYIIGLILVLFCLLWDLRSTWNLRWYKDRRTGATGMWTVVTLLLYLTISAAIILHLWNMGEAKKIEFVAGKYFSIHRLGYTVQIERGMWSISSFGVWFRLLRFSAQFPYVGILGRTIGKAIPRVFVFVLISSVILLAFAQCFFMAYYASVDGYQSYQASIMSVMRFTILDFDYQALSNENRLLTPILFFLLLMVVFYIWVNVMVAIISDVYQQEYKAYGSIEVDEDFDSMLPDIPEPQNDQEAMHRHYPVHASDEYVPVDPIALTPDRFFRVRMCDLDQFKSLVTIDIRSHFMKLALLSELKRGDGFVGVEGHGHRQDPPVETDLFPDEHSPQFPGTGGLHQRDIRHGLSEAQVNPLDDRYLGEIEMNAQGGVHGGGPVSPLEAQAVAQGVFKQNTRGESMLDLEQHRGIYARMGSLAPPPYPSEGHVQEEVTDTTGQPQPTRNGKKGGTQTQPFELQAVYFEKRFHNLTSAKLWWDKHKAVFDSREQLMQHMMHSSKKALYKLGITTAQKVSKLNPLTSTWRHGSTGLPVHRRPFGTQPPGPHRENGVSPGSGPSLTGVP